VLAVFVERGGADRPQFAAGEHRLEQVGGVDGALGGAGAHDRVKLVEEEDDPSLALGHLLEHGLEAVLELTAVLGTGDQRAHVESDHAAVAQRVGHVARDDALGEAFDDRRLADPGLADEHGVVLGAPRQHLDHAPNLVVAPDHRVELARFGGLCEVVAVGLERLVLLLGILVGHPVRATHGHDGFGQLVARRSRVQIGLGGEGEQQVLARDVLVAHAARLAVGALEHPGQLSADRGRRRRLARHRGKRGQRLVGPAAHAVGIGPRAPEHGHHDAALLFEQDEQQVSRDHLGVRPGARQRLSGGDGLLRLYRESVQLHEKI